MYVLVSKTSHLFNGTGLALKTLSRLKRPCRPCKYLPPVQVLVLVLDVSAVKGRGFRVFYRLDPDWLSIAEIVGNLLNARKGNGGTYAHEATEVHTRGLSSPLD